ncbi:unnamed protein product [Closterium sp. NIES-54]
MRNDYLSCIKEVHFCLRNRLPIDCNHRPLTRNTCRNSSTYYYNSSRPTTCKTRHLSKCAGAAGVGGAAGVAARGTGAAGPGGARTGGTEAAGAGGTAGVGTRDTGAGGAGPGGAGAVGAGSRETGRPRPPNVPCLLATVVTDPSFESAGASALVAELVDFAATCRLDYATSLVAESKSVSPPSVGGECALGTDVLEDRQEDFECFVAAVPHLVSMLIAPEGDPGAPDIPTPRSYAEAITVPPPGANIVDGMWIFRVKRPPGSPPAFKAHYIARGFSQRQGVDFFQTFSPTLKMTTLQVLLHVAAQCSEWSLRRPVYGLRQTPRKWHDTLRTTLAALGFAASTADPSLFLRTVTSLPPFYILVYAEDLVFATADTEALALVKSELQKRHTCTELDELCSYLGLQIIQDRARRTITLTLSHMVHQVL